MLRRVTKSVKRRFWQWRYPRHYWHMRHYDRRFGLRPAASGLEVLWQGRVVALSTPLDRSGGKADGAAIVASGPSLLDTPEDAWRSRDVICVNGSILWAQERGVRPRFYVVSDPGFAKRRLDLIELACTKAERVCLSTRCLFEVLRQKPDMLRGRPLFVFENINQPFGRACYSRAEMAGRPHVHLDPQRTFEERYIGISADLDLGIFAGGTVVLAAAQLAMALGYRDVQFLGLDMKLGAGKPRFYEERRPEPSFIDRNFDDLIIPSFEALRVYCDRHQIRLGNWSPDSAIPRHLVPRVDAGG